MDLSSTIPEVNKSEENKILQPTNNSKNILLIILITTFISIIIALLVGGGVYVWEQSQQKAAKIQLQSEVDELKNKIEKVELEKNDLIQKADKAEAEKQSIEQKTCKGTWKNGICVQSACVDSDVNQKPDDIYIKGNVTYTDKNGVSTTVYDECTGSKQQVNEMWCYESPSGSGNYVQGSMISNCPNGCLDGACIKK